MHIVFTSALCPGPSVTFAMGKEHMPNPFGHTLETTGQTVSKLNTSRRRNCNKASSHLQTQTQTHTHHSHRHVHMQWDTNTHTCTHTHMHTHTHTHTHKHTHTHQNSKSPRHASSFLIYCTVSLSHQPGMPSHWDVISVECYLNGTFPVANVIFFIRNRS